MATHDVRGFSGIQKRVINNPQKQPACRLQRQRSTRCGWINGREREGLEGRESHSNKKKKKKNG